MPKMMPRSQREAFELMPHSEGCRWLLFREPCTCDKRIKLEAVDHPAHYGGADNVYETIKVVDAWGLDFALGNAVKYISRAGKKDPTKTIEDLEKARFYLNHAIERLKSAKP